MATITLDYAAPAPEISLIKRIDRIEDTNGNTVPGDAGDTVFYTFEVRNTGDVSLGSVTVSDPMLGVVDIPLVPEDLAPGETALLASQPYVVDADDIARGYLENAATASGQPVATDGAGDPIPGTPLFDASGPLPAVSDTSDAAQPPFTADSPVPTELLDPESTETPDGLGGTDGIADNDPTVLLLPGLGTPGDLAIEKTAGVATARIGDAIPYEIVVTNQTTSLIGPIDLVDTLPAGLVFIEGSATLGGGAVTPVSSGNRVMFSGLSVPASGSVTVSLSARVTGTVQAGELVNLAQVYDPVSGSPLTAAASAIVRIAMEPVFHCTDIIGKVFDDLDQDGYQDGSYRDPRVTDQTYDGGKFAVSPERIGEIAGEPGLAGVRVVTPRGTVITTDEFGRFHVPCAELPDRIGSNFTLKVDERSLPTGYRMTTENPRTIRVTPGKVAKMNFGASIGRVVDINLSARAFDGLEPSPALKRAVRALSKQIDGPVSILRLSYLPGRGESERAIKRRMDEVEDLIRKHWRTAGRYRLIIERTIQKSR